LQNLKKISEKTNLFFQKSLQILFPQGKDLLLLVALQYGFIILFWLWLTFVIHEPNHYWFFSPAIFLLGILGAVLAGIVAATLIKSFQSIPFLFLTALGFGLVISAYITSSVARNWQTVLVINLWLILPPILLGFGKAYIQKQTPGKWVYRIIGWLFLGVGSLAIVLGTIWIFLPGFSTHNQIPQVVDTRPEVMPINAENPSLPGSYAIQTLTYGSGLDLNRDAFASEATLITKSVDASAFLPSLDNFPGKLYKLQWGFDKTELPLNGRVWYPEGDGPFPLVLIVHGNHTALDFSDEGYAYLGELLASRGMIFVSVDENFLNSTWINAISNDYSHQENDARGWLLLQHLEQFRKWHSDADNPFFEKVDWNKIALVGHSRGGEAITEAANFNALGVYPDNGNITFPKTFNIQTLIAIAPVDSQYNPASQDTPIEDVDYLVIQGSADADLKNFPGQAAYARTSFPNLDEFHFKSSIYLHGANHGQFNTSWGAADNGKLSYYLLDRQQLIDQEIQQHTAQVLISAFLEASLNDNESYRLFFEDPRQGNAWLTDVSIWSQYADSTEFAIINFEEDINLRTGTLPNSVIKARSFDSWREAVLYGNRNRAIGNSVVTLSWDTAARPSAKYEIQFTNSIQFSLEQKLVFSAAATTEEELEEETETILPVNFSIQLSDGNTTATLPSNPYALLYENPPLSLSKAHFMDTITGADTVLQSVRIPIADFESVNPDLDFSNIKSITFIFDQTQQGKIWLDDIGIR
jgi:hypothetical protein